MRYEITDLLTLVHVNSYQCKEKIKTLGGRWKPENKGWKMPNQEAYDQAWALCETVDEENDSRSAYYNQYDDVVVDWDLPQDKLVLPLKENTNKPVKSGQKFLSGRKPGVKENEWIVVSKTQVWGDWEIICESLVGDNERHMTEEEIRAVPWTGFNVDEARRRFNQRKQRKTQADITDF